MQQSTRSPLLPLMICHKPHHNLSLTIQPTLQMEEERRKHEPPTETERLQAAANSNTRNRAEDLLTEQRDEVKHMNQMVQYSKCVTIR